MAEKVGALHCYKSMNTSKEHKGRKVHWEPTEQTKAAFFIRSRAEYSRKIFSKAYLDH